MIMMFIAALCAIVWTIGLHVVGASGDFVVGALVVGGLQAHLQLVCTQAFEAQYPDFAKKPHWALASLQPPPPFGFAIGAPDGSLVGATEGVLVGASLRTMLPIFFVLRDGVVKVAEKPLPFSLSSDLNLMNI
jgi:hypothetical protein